MPLPNTDPIPFRGVPSRGEDKKIALSMTLTQKQVEAMFARQATLNQTSLAAQFPLEIDFENNKLFIGDIAAPFENIKELGIREICQRTPTPSKPLAGMFLCGNIVGKLIIHRELDQDISDSVRKATEAETSKRNERTIVRLDAPPVTTSGKKSRSGASALAKKAMSNVRTAKGGSSRPSTSSLVASLASQIPASTSTPFAISSKTASQSTTTTTKSSNPTSSNSSSNSPEEIVPDLNTFRSRLIHFLAPEPRTTQAIVEKFHNGRKPESVEEIEDLLLKVATESTSKGLHPTTAKLWEPLQRSYLEVRPWEVPDCTQEERLRMARKARIAIGSMVKQSDPQWRHWNTPTEKIDTQVTTPFKGGMYPAKDKKLVPKASTVSGGSGNTKGKAAARPKPKDLADAVESKVEAKVRRISNSVLADSKGKGKAGLNSPSISLSSLSKIPRQKPADGDIAKPRLSSSTSTKREPSPVPPKPRVSLDERKRKLESEATSEVEEGELPVKKRKVVGDPEPKKLNSLKRSTESRLPPPKKANADKGKTFVKEETQPTTKLMKEVTTSAKASSNISSKNVGTSRAVKQGKEDSECDRADRDREREREKREKDRERERKRERAQEREDKELEQEKERRRLSNKRGRRATPSFSSDEEEIDAPPKKRMAAAPRPTLSSLSGSKVASQSVSSKLTSVPKTSSNTPPRAAAPSPALPAGKDALRREYQIKYARYMSITSKVHEQRAKIEALLAMDEDTLSVDDDSDVMDAEALVKLCGEHDRLTSELEKIRNAHRNAM